MFEHVCSHSDVDYVVRHQFIYLHIMFEHVCSNSDIDYVVNHQFTEARQEVTTFVQLFYFYILINVIYKILMKNILQM